MTFEEMLEEALGSVQLDAVVKADLKTKIISANATDTANLKSNKEDILNEKRALKTELDEVKTKLVGLEGYTPDKVKKLEEDIQKLRDNPGDGEKLKQLEESYKIRFEAVENEKKVLLQSKEQELQEAIKKIEDLDSKQNEVMMKNQLSESLDKVYVKTDFKPMLLQSLMLNTFVKDVDGKKVVKFRGQSNVEFDISEGISLWAKLPENSIYIGAPRNVGAGGAGSGTAVSKILKKPFSSMSPSERQQLYVEAPELYKKARANQGTALE